MNENGNRMDAIAAVADIVVLPAWAVWRAR